MTLLVPAANPAVKEVKLEPLKDFLPLLFTDTASGEAGLVFAGWGISAPEIGYDDYAGIDVKGKFVLCFRGTPDPADRRFQHHDEHRTRMAAAKAKGVLGFMNRINPEIMSDIAKVAFLSGHTWANR